MHDPVDTQLYLTAPALASFDAAALSSALETGVACLLLDVSGFVEAETSALEQMLDCAHAAECPLVVGGDDTMALDLARRFALDGVHLSNGPKQIEWARKQLGQDAIVGYGAGPSRDDAMTAAEGGADYIALGPLSALDPDLLTWWQAVIETPLVIELDPDATAPGPAIGTADFVLLPASLWDGNPTATLAALKSTA